MFFKIVISIMQRFKSKTIEHRTPNIEIMSTPTPFCKVCRDAGCSESEYTSHFVKDQPGPAGKVVCPTLLNQACRICGEKGHTSSYCKQNKYIQQPKSNDNYAENQQGRQSDRHQSRAPYAHPHGPRIRLQLDSPALSLAVSVVEKEKSKERAHEWCELPIPQIDVRKVDLNHSRIWGDETVATMDEEFRRIAEEIYMNSLISDKDYALIEAFDNNNERGMPLFECGD